jgi:hypothetical protein
MKFKKQILGELARCYSNNYLTIDGSNVLLYASEQVGGNLVAYYGKDYKESASPSSFLGGTMSIVNIPNKDNEFLVTQGFYPGFEAKGSSVSHLKLINNNFEIQEIVTIPYLHRFDCFYQNGIYYFVGATLCKNKENREDWSSPGEIIVAEFDQDLTKLSNIQVLKEGLTKNHGYFKYQYKGKLSSFITCEEGVFVVSPPSSKTGKWSIEQILSTPTSDIALIDIDYDNELELITISPFHGKELNIYKFIDGKYQIVWTYQEETDFIHALASGTLLGVNSFVVGARRVNKELFVIQYDKTTKEYKTTLIDKDCGTSNVTILNNKEGDYILASNNGVHQAVLYQVDK